MSEPTKLGKEIMETIHKHGKTNTNEIAADLGKDNRAIRGALKSLKESGYIKSNGEITLTEKGEKCLTPVQETPEVPQEVPQVSPAGEPVTGTPAKPEKKRKKTERTTILSAILEIFPDKAGSSMSAEEMVAAIKGKYPDLEFNEKSVGLHLRALTVGAASNPSINQHAFLMYSKESKLFTRL